MNKRNLIVAAAVSAAIGSGAVLAGSNYCQHQDGHGYSQDHRKHHHHGYRHGGERGDYMLKKLDRHLDLSDEQEASLKEVFSAGNDQRKERRQAQRELMQQAMQLDPMSGSYDAESAALADQVAELARQRTLDMAAKQKQVAAVLTPEQREEFRSMMQHRMDRKHHHRGHQDS